jgi:ribosomal protein S2
MNSLSKREIAKRYVKASIHYGHRPREWNPKMAPYLLYTKYGYHIFDLVKTSKLLHLAGNILEQKVKRGKICLFVGTGKISAPLISKYAKQCNSFYINYRWLGGILTNWTTIQKRIAQLKELEALEIKGWLNQMSKKETRKKRKRLEKLRRLFQGIKDMPTLPDIVVFTNTLKDSLAIPSQAVVINARGKMVYIVDKDGKAVAKPIKVVYEYQGLTVVTGIEPGDRVVVEGKQNLRPGSKVREAKNAMPASNPGSPVATTPSTAAPATPPAPDKK